MYSLIQEKGQKSHKPAANTPARIDTPIGLTNVAANESSTTSLKRVGEIIKGHEDIEPRSVNECKERHWNGIKHILRYLRGTTDMGLFYSNESSNGPNLVRYVDSRYLSDPHKGRSQTGYVYLWKYNDLIAIYQTNFGCYLF
ncbi:unnamed protein product [Prunus brigantina]